MKKEEITQVERGLHNSIDNHFYNFEQLLELKNEVDIYMNEYIDQYLEQYYEIEFRDWKKEQGIPNLMDALQEIEYTFKEV
jgi:hypothetical protein